MRQIPTDSLPANFLDAIKICRYLEIDYLWIDSLCIIQDQDSKDDWNKQAAQMSDIYENAYVTIAATRSADASGGCFSRRHPKYLAEPVPGYEGVFVSVEPPGLPVDFKDSLIKSNLPLLDRGWVYQEMRLSRRVLHFCDEQVVWTCQTSGFSEGKCDDWATPPVITHEDMSYEQMPFGLPSKNPRLLWYRWVHEYSRLQLTYPDKDRMAALAGLAKRMQNHHDMGRYLSGLWETSLSVDLGWLTKRPASGGPQESSTNHPWNIPNYPTWSWASVKAPIEWESWGASSLEPLARVRKIDYHADGPVHMGGVLKSSGSITIEAPVFDSSNLYPPTLPNETPTKVNGIVIKSYKPDRTNQKHGLVMGGLIVVVSMWVGLSFGYAQAIHVKQRTGYNTYERIGFVELDYRGYVREGKDYDPFEDIIEPWDDLPLREITIV
ncbi:tol protein [Colletotrichum kahawae]|uniref:Tol protein n=1 Tax=Colletotrichum kahawae TaxID=34407 RepID=A0AAD9YLR8_COLKA|nr:tol protein [Colletotrichum kahawae]